jgi:peptidoglycan hydrolase-like protein with peptidoglycan-binding domain
LTPGEEYTISIVQSALEILKIEDMVFRTDSAVYLPDFPDDPATPAANEKQQKVQGLAMLKMVMMYAEKNSGKKKRLLCAGHSDTTSTPAYNRTLSGYRASSTMSLLAGKKDVWTDLFSSQKQKGVSTYQDKDIQHLLTWSASARSWDCSPGKIDGIIGDKTASAIKKFQICYNKDFRQSIKEDGKIGEQTWGAFFDVLEGDLRKSVDAELKKTYPEDTPTFDSVRNAVVWFDKRGDPRKSCASCGETFPITDDKKDNTQSLQCRRVEILFFYEGEDISLACIEGQCEGKACPVYGKDEQGNDKIPRIYLTPNESFGVPVTILVSEYVSDESLDGLPFTIEWGTESNQRVSDMVKEGSIEAVVPQGFKNAELTVWADSEKNEALFFIELTIDSLDEIETDTGVQQRLNNLGFDAGPVNGVIGPVTEEAIKHFQFYAKMKVTGKADATTRAKIVEAYGS